MMMIVVVVVFVVDSRVVTLSESAVPDDAKQIKTFVLLKANAAVEEKFLET